MPSFQLEILIGNEVDNSAERHVFILEVEDIYDLNREIKVRIRDVFTKPNALVILNSENFQFTIGVGLWSHSGYYIVAMNDIGLSAANTARVRNVARRRWQ